MTSAIAVKPAASLISPLSTRPARPPSAPNHTRIPTMLIRSSLSCEISGRSASYGPPLSVLVIAYSSKMTKKYTATTVRLASGGVKSRNPNRAQNGVARRMYGRRRPRRERVRSLR